MAKATTFLLRAKHVWPSTMKKIITFYPAWACCISQGSHLATITDSVDRNETNASCNNSHDAFPTKDFYHDSALKEHKP